jgi:transposase InsO family protein
MTRASRVGRTQAASSAQGAGVESPPSPSAITDILARNGLLSAERRLERAYQRFEAEKPNQTWQMDFKGDFALAEGRCYPLTILDDHSRFNLCLQVPSTQPGQTAQPLLTAVTSEYGMPEVLRYSVPVHRYTPSSRPLAGALPASEYPGDDVRRVQTQCEISSRGKEMKIGGAFSGDLSPFELQETASEVC